MDLLLASGSNDNTILIWDLTTGTVKRNLTGHSDWINALTTLKNGDLVTVSTDRGSLALPIEVSEILDDVIWLPRNGVGAESLRILGALNGDGVKVRKGI